MSKLSKANRMARKAKRKYVKSEMKKEDVSRKVAGNPRLKGAKRRGYKEAVKDTYGMPTFKH